MSREYDGGKSSRTELGDISLQDQIPSPLSPAAKLWDVATGAELHTLGGYALSLCWPPRSRDGAVCVLIQLTALTVAGYCNTEVGVRDMGVGDLRIEEMVCYCFVAPRRHGGGRSVKRRDGGVRECRTPRRR